MFVFDKCCFCIDLKKGCFIIAYLSLIDYFIYSVIGIVGISGGVELAYNPDVLDDKNIKIIDINKDNKDDVSLAIIVLSALLLLLVMVMLTFTIVLLLGLHKNKPGHLKVYLVYACIFSILSIMGFIGSVSNGKRKAFFNVLDIFNILWSIYTTLVIRSQYFAMRDPERRPAIYSA